MIRLYCDFCENEILETHLVNSHKLLHWNLSLQPSDTEKRIITDGNYQICKDCRNQILQLRKKKESTSHSFSSVKESKN